MTTDQEAFEAWAEKLLFKSSSEKYLAKEAWHAALAYLRSQQEPVAWMSPGKERLEFSRKDTVYGSHTIPLYTAPEPSK